MKAYVRVALHCFESVSYRHAILEAIIQLLRKRGTTTSGTYIAYIDQAVLGPAGRTTM